ncbi:MAG: LysR family transcriptional regulator [Pseudomonadota bacterium]
MNQIFRPDAHAPRPSASLDIDILRSVVAIAEGGSIASAAQRVARTPAAVSMQIKKLEEMLGRSLFERTRQGMTPNAEGERLLEYARRMIELNREALQAFSGPELEGRVSFGHVDSFKGDRLAEVLGSFARSHPKVTVDVSMTSTVRLVPEMQAGNLDVMIFSPGGITPLREGDVVLREDQMIWIGSEGGAAMRQRPVPLAVSEEGCPWRKEAVNALAGAAIPTRLAYVADFDEGQMAAVRADLAIAPMPRCYLKPGLQEHGARDGLPKLGICRLAMRVSENAPCVARALAARIADTFGKRLEAEAVN